MNVLLENTEVALFVLGVAIVGFAILAPERVLQIQIVWTALKRISIIALGLAVFVIAYWINDAPKDNITAKNDNNAAKNDIITAKCDIKGLTAGIAEVSGMLETFKSMYPDVYLGTDKISDSTFLKRRDRLRRAIERAAQSFAKLDPPIENCGNEQNPGASP